MIGRPMAPSPPAFAALLSELPEKSRPIFCRLAASMPPGITPTTLRALLDDHLRDVREASRSNTSIAVELAQHVAEACRAALRSWPALDPDARRVLTAAVNYFALRRDSSDDFAAPTGFEDDARVVNAVLAWIGRSDLRVELV